MAEDAVVRACLEQNGFDPALAGSGLLNDANHEPYNTSMAQERPFDDAIQLGDMMAAAEAFLTRWGLPGEWEAMPDVAKEVMASRMWLIPAQSDGIINDGPLRMKPDAIRDLDVPTLVMHGGNSPAIMDAITEVISGAMPKGQSDVLDQAGHMLPITHHAECAAKPRVFWGL